ncbi:hypothetical protein HDU96_002623 [Phlyctochytrium bullatum]|nr:hypothetical protein HDU96_002623 [Phlyctochytrium bullatum]
MQRLDASTQLILLITAQALDSATDAVAVAVAVLASAATACQNVRLPRPGLPPAEEEDFLSHQAKGRKNFDLWIGYLLGPVSHSSTTQHTALRARKGPFGTVSVCGGYGVPVAPVQNPTPANRSQLPGAYPTATTPLLGGNYSAAPDLKASLKFLIFDDWLNVLLVFLPFGLVAGHFEWSAPFVFGLNFLALIPLAKVLGTCTEELALYTNPTIGGLLNATLGNLVELLVSVAALRAGLVGVVQSSLLGSVLSNLLLVLGLSFLCGGLRFSEQSFNETAALTGGSLLAITVCAFVLPAAFKIALAGAAVPNAEELVLNLSRGTAVVLFLMYILYLLFQLKTHKHLYESSDEDETKPQMTMSSVLVMLVLVTLAVSFSAEYLVDSIEGISESWHLSKTFLGLVVIPIVGNAAEHMTAVTVAMKNKMDLSIAIAVGSSLQICLFATPFCVLTGWALNQPMSLAFGLFETAVVFTSVYVVNSLISDGKSNWLEGAMLLSAYAIITIAFYLL